MSQTNQFTAHEYVKLDRLVTSQSWSPSCVNAVVNENVNARSMLDHI